MLVAGLPQPGSKMWLQSRQPFGTFPRGSMFTWSRYGGFKETFVDILGIRVPTVPKFREANICQISADFSAT